MRIGTFSRSSFHSHLANASDVRYIESLVPLEFGSDAIEVPSANCLLKKLSEVQATWAIVASGSQSLLAGWLSLLDLAVPQYSVVADDVTLGKPDPECYQLAKRRLQLDDDTEALVIEYAPAGIHAGKAAGCRVLALTTTHTLAEVRAIGADWVAKDLKSIRLVEWNDQKLNLEILGQ